MNSAMWRTPAPSSAALTLVVIHGVRAAYLDHERAKTELKALIPEDAKEAIGHGVRAERSKSGAVSFDLLKTKATHAPLQ
jgi:hypothetical protein